MSIIQFDFSSKLLYVALYYIFTIITREIKDGLKNIQSNNNEFNSWNNIFDSNTLNIPIMISILQLSGIIISNKRNKKKRQEENIENRNSSPLEIQKESMIERKNKITNKEIILLIICGIFEGFRYYYSLATNKGKGNISYYICGLLLFEIMILSHFILKIHSYRHHYVSLGIMLICDILLAYKSNLNNFKGFLNKLLMNHYENGFDFLFSAFKICLEKYLMHYLYIDIFLILFYEGIVQIIFLFLLMIYFLIKNSSEFLNNQKRFWIEVNDYKILMIIDIFTLFSLKCLELLINESFDPSYLILASGTYILYQYKHLIEYFFNKNDKVKTPLLNFIIYSGYLISIIIFSELIVPNIFNFSKFTRKRIKERERTESNQIKNEILEQSIIFERSFSNNLFTQ